MLNIYLAIHQPFVPDPDMEQTTTIQGSGITARAAPATLQPYERDDSDVPTDFATKLRGASILSQEQQIDVATTDFSHINRSNSVIVTDNWDLHERALENGKCSLYLAPGSQFNADHIIGMIRKFSEKIQAASAGAAASTESTPLRAADAATLGDAAIDLLDEKYLKAFRDMRRVDGGLGAKDLWKILWAFLAAGGSFPFVIFSGEFAEEIFKNEEWLVYWSLGASGLVNCGITFTALDQIPDVLNRLKAIINKLERAEHIPEKYRLNKAKLALAAVSLLLVNMGSFLANLALAGDSTQQFSEGMQKFLIVFQMLGATALVARATLSRTLPMAFPENPEISATIKGSILSQLNQLLPATDRLAAEDIALLQEGKTIRNERTWLRWGVAAVPLLLTGVYSGAFAAGAYSVTSAASWLGAAADAIGGASAAAAGISKYALLGLAGYNMGAKFETFIGELLGEKILPTEHDWSTGWNIALNLAIAAGLTWNTGWSASEIAQKHLIDLFVKSTFYSRLTSIIVGIGGSLPINHGDTVNFVKRVMNYFSGKKPSSSFVEFIKAEMQHIVNMTPRATMEKFTVPVAGASAAGLAAYESGDEPETIDDKLKKFAVEYSKEYEEFMLSLFLLSELSEEGREHYYAAWKAEDYPAATPAPSVSTTPIQPYTTGDELPDGRAAAADYQPRRDSSSRFFKDIGAAADDAGRATDARNQAALYELFTGVKVPGAY